MSGKDVSLRLGFAFDDVRLSDRLVEILVNQTHTSVDSAKQANSGRADAESSSQHACTVYKTVHVNSLVLAAQSDYFKTMFTNGMKESSQSTIQLVCESEQEALGTWQLLRLMYYNDIRAACGDDVNNDDVILRLAEVADKYRMQGALQTCDQLLAGKPRSDAEWDVLLAGWCLPELIPKTMAAYTQKLEERFHVFDHIWRDKAQRYKFLHLRIWEVQLLVDSDKVQAHHENSVWTLVERWFLHKGLRQFSDLGQDHMRLLRSVRYRYMSPSFLADVVNKSPFMTDVCMMHLVLEALAWQAGAHREEEKEGRSRSKPKRPAPTKSPAGSILISPNELVLITTVLEVFSFNLRQAEKELREVGDAHFHEKQLLVNGYIVQVGLQFCEGEYKAFFAFACGYHPPSAKLESRGVTYHFSTNYPGRKRKRLGELHKLSVDPFIPMTHGLVGRYFATFPDSPGARFLKGLHNYAKLGNVYVELELKFDRDGMF